MMRAESKKIIFNTFTDDRYENGLNIMAVMSVSYTCVLSRNILLNVSENILRCSIIKFLLRRTVEQWPKIQFFQHNPR